MKFTPIDIQRREFTKGFRGIDESEVRAFLHEVSSDWEELLAENQRLKEELLESRERLRQYGEQDRIFRETLLQAQRTKEDVLDTANREKEIVLKEAQFKADEVIREAQQHVVEIEVQIRNLKMERMRMLQDLESLLERTRRFVQQEAPDLYAPAPPTLNLEHMDFSSLEDPKPRKPRA